MTLQQGPRGAVTRLATDATELLGRRCHDVAVEWMSKGDPRHCGRAFGSWSVRAGSPGWQSRRQDTERLVSPVPAAPGRDNGPVTCQWVGHSAKWALMGAGALLVGLSAFNLWGSVAPTSRRLQADLILEGGSLTFFRVPGFVRPAGPTGLRVRRKLIGAFENWHLRPMLHTDVNGVGGVLVALPHWLSFVVVAPLGVAAWWPDIRAARRRRAGLCGFCGYSRAGFTPDAKCPECGTIPKGS
jgi:hypothetical protein